MSDSRVVLVTGASRGIGLEVALQFARRGDRVVMVANDEEGLKRSASKVELLTEVLTFFADISDERQVNDFVQKIIDKWGQIDILISNAGSLVYGSVEDCKVEDFKNQIYVNYLGGVYLTKAILPIMRKQDYGSLVYVSSISGRIYLPNNAAYQASKAALSAFVLTLRRELIRTRIGVSLITPGRTKTGIVNHAVVRSVNRGEPMIREMTVQKVANLIFKATENPQREVIRPLILKSLLLVYNIFPDIVETWVPWIQAQWGKMKKNNNVSLDNNDKM